MTTTTLSTRPPDFSWFGSGGSLAMANFKTTTASSATNLFPFASLNPTSYTNNYQLWVGKCQQEQPPAGINPATVTPGRTRAGCRCRRRPCTS